MWEWMQKGGPLMYPILLCSILGVAIIIERLVTFYRAKIDTKKFIENISESLKRNKVVEALEKCSATPGPIAAILKAGIMKHDRPKHEIKEAIMEEASFEVPKLEKHLSILATIAHISPLLGLLGTVTGMVRTFQVIQQKASSLAPINPSDLAGGIWEALITTVAGLAVAIPMFVAYNYLISIVDSFVLDMEKSATDLVNFFSSRQDSYEV